jgi:hypothetical protein
VIVTDDIRDPWLRRIVALGNACLSAKLAESYERADESASRQQTWHRRITLACALFGTLALLMGIGQLATGSWKEVSAVERPASGPTSPPEKPAPAKASFDWVLTIEGVLVAIPIVGVFVGYFSHRKTEWLYRRYEAERFRSSSFYVLIEPGFWGPEEPSQTDWNAAVDTEKRNISSIRDAEEAAKLDEALTVPKPETCASARVELTRRVAAHYRERRLKPQIGYLQKLIDRKNWLDNSVLQPSVFILSVFVVGLHFVLELTRHEKLNIALVFLAAAIPVGWTGFRTWRGANEHARNVSRSSAKKDLLQAQSDWLANELGQTHPDRFRIFTALAISENLLRNELREWLRLMLETEWYG